MRTWTERKAKDVQMVECLFSDLQLMKKVVTDIKGMIIIVSGYTTQHETL